MRPIKALLFFVVVAFIVGILWVSFTYISSSRESETELESRHVPKMSTEDTTPLKEPVKKPVARKYEAEEFQAGMNLLVYGPPDLEAAKSHFAHFRELGLNSVTITFPFYQEDWQANEVKADPDITPSIDEITSLIEAAQKEELSVMLRPTMDEQTLMETGHWRGQIQPANPEEWFNSYSELLQQYAELAEENRVEYFNIGTELNSMENQYSDEWIKLIEELRMHYDGELIYSFNWDTVKNISSIEFVQQLDHVGVDAYYPLDLSDGASVEQLSQAWNKWTEQLAVQVDHPSVIITEAGMIPIEGAYRTPFAWSIPGGTVDRQAQADYYEATYEALKPLSKGIYWWGVTLDGDPGNDSVDYSPLNGPAEDVIRQMFVDEDANK